MRLGDSGGLITTSGTRPVRSASSAAQSRSCGGAAAAEDEPCGVEEAAQPVPHRPLGLPSGAAARAPARRAAAARQHREGGARGARHLVRPGACEAHAGREREFVGDGGMAALQHDVRGMFSGNCARDQPAPRRGAGAGAQARSRAFCSANSSAVRMPALCSSASFCSRPIASSLSAAGARRAPPARARPAPPRVTPARGLAPGDLAGDGGGGAGDHRGAGGGLGGAADQAGASASGSEHGESSWGQPAWARSWARASTITASGMRSESTSSPFGGADGDGEAGRPDVLEEERGGGACRGRARRRAPAGRPRRGAR